MPPSRTIPHNGPAIRALRERAGLKIPALAAQLGIHRQSLSNIELNNKSVSAALLNRIARALTQELGTDFSDILDAISAPAPPSQ